MPISSMTSSSVAGVAQQRPQGPGKEIRESSSTSGTSSAQDLFKAMLNNLGSALQSGDLSGAQKAFSSLAPRGSQGVNVLA